MKSRRYSTLPDASGRDSSLLSILFHFFLHILLSLPDKYLLHGAWEELNSHTQQHVQK